MRLRSDICLACIPFTAGVALTAMLPEHLCATAAAVSLPCAIVSALGFLHDGRRKAYILSALLFAGIFCQCCSGLGVSVHTGGGIAEKAMDRLCARIDSLEFRHAGTGGLVKALVTGRKDGLDPATVEAFRICGTSHILALSGMHLCVLYAMISTALSWTGGNRTALAARSILSVLLCSCYCAMAGSGESLVRAVLFVCVNEAARNFPGRRRLSGNVFCAALTVQLIIDPGAVRSVGFQLSYLSVLAIITLYPKLDALVRAEDGKAVKKIWSAAALSISCQLYTAPAVLWYFRSFPPYFLISNLIGVPLSSALMIVSIICILLGLPGICPDMMLRLTEMLSQALILTMDTVSGF